MNMGIISATEIRSLVSYRDLIEPVSRAFQESSAGRALNGMVVMSPLEDRLRGDVYVKTGIVRGASLYIVKVAPWFAANVERGDPQGGFIAAFDSATGHVLALLDDQHYLSDIRTAAAGALVARLLAPPKIDTAGILGSGTQAYWQALALHGERPFERLSIWARDAAKAELLVARLAPKLPEVRIRIDADPEHVVRTSQVLITATASRDALVQAAWLQPGQHVTAVGADDETKCELEPAALLRARVFVDSVEASIANGDVRRAIERGDYFPDLIAGEIGEVLTGRVKGRETPEDITIAKLIGLGAQDVMTAEVVIERITKRNDHNAN